MKNVAAARRWSAVEPLRWLVIGAGFAGLAAAKRLSQLRPEDRIVLLEGKRVAEGPGGNLVWGRRKPREAHRGATRRG